MVVDDHAVVRAAIVRLLDAVPDIEVCAQAATIEETEELAGRLRPDVVLIDLHLGDLTCIEVSRRIRDRHPTIQFAMLTGASDQEALLASVLAGAAAFLPKQLRGTDLVGSVRRVASGQRLLDQEAVASLVEALAEPSPPVGNDGTPPLDDRTLLSLLATGCTDHEIEQTLGLDDSTLRLRLAGFLTLLGLQRVGHRSPSESFKKFSVSPPGDRFFKATYRNEAWT